MPYAEREERAGSGVLSVAWLLLSLSLSHPIFGTCVVNLILSRSSSCWGVPGSQSCGAARTPASKMFPPAPESAALPSAAVGNPPPQESEERSDDASLNRKMMAWKLPMNGASEGVAMMGTDSWPALAESAAMGRSKPSSSKILSPSVKLLSFVSFFIVLSKERCHLDPSRILNLHVCVILGFFSGSQFQPELGPCAPET